MLRSYSVAWRLAVLCVVVVASVGQLAAAVPVGGESTSVAQQSGPKIYIAADREGLAGVVTFPRPAASQTSQEVPR